MEPNLPEKEMAELKKVFLALDEDASGLITLEELGSIFQDPRMKMSENDVQDLLKDFDVDGSGAIDIGEFLALMSNQKNKEYRELIHQALILRSATRKEFKEFDTNGDGFITKDEFMTVMRRKNKGNITKAQIKALLRDADKNGDGKIDYDEFLLTMTKQ